MIVGRVDELVGNTPLLEAVSIERELGLKSRVLLKLEYLNPTGSVKDRAALAMIDDAERSGRLGEGGTIIEPTSGNTGIGLAAIGTSRGYRVIIVMPDSMSEERRRLMRAYGAELVLTPGAEGMAGAIRKAESLSKEIPGSIVCGQFSNRANADAHYRTTGPEIWKDTDGHLDILVSAVGSGGTITGAGRYLKERDPSVSVVAVEPSASPVLSGGKAGRHGIQGIGAGFVPEVLDRGVIDAVETVSDEEAMEYARLAARKEGVLLGISSGAALAVALRLARKTEGKTIVAVMPDSGDRYLSGALYAGVDA